MSLFVTAVLAWASIVSARDRDRAGVVTDLKVRSKTGWEIITLACISMHVVKDDWLMHCRHIEGGRWFVHEQIRSRRQLLIYWGVWGISRGDMRCMHLTTRAEPHVYVCQQAKYEKHCTIKGLHRKGKTRQVQNDVLVWASVSQQLCFDYFEMFCTIAICILI